MVPGVRLEAGAKVERPGVTPQLGSRVSMDLLGGHREDRILITHGVQVEKAEEIPKQRMGDEAGHRDWEMDGKPPRLEAVVDVGGAFDLKDQAWRELTANVGFHVAPFVVRHWLVDLEVAAAAQHEELHVLLLGDEALLGGTDRRHARRMNCKGGGHP